MEVRCTRPSILKMGVRCAAPQATAASSHKSSLGACAALGVPNWVDSRVAAPPGGFGVDARVLRTGSAVLRPLRKNPPAHTFFVLKDGDGA